jgi:uncharacterized phage-associated protein
MTWPVIASLIVQYGIPLTDKLIQKWLAGTPVTAADYAEVRAIASQTSTDIMKKKLTEAGIPLDSDAAKVLLQLT